MNARITLLLLAPVPLSACSTPAAPPAAEAGAESAAAAVKVATAAVTERDFAEYVMVTGEVEPARSTMVAANATGRILEMLVDRGDSVKAGDPIARLDARQATRNLDAVKVQKQLAATQAAQADRECARAEQLHKEGVIATADEQAADARCEAARLQVKAAEAQASIIDIAVGDAVVRAPFDGIVSKQMTDEGSFVQPPSPVIELQQIDPVTVVLQVPAVHVGLVAMDQAVTVELPDLVELGRLTGKVTRIAPSLTRDTRALVVEVELPNPEHKIRGGLFARGQIEVGRKKAPAIPVDAVVEREDRLRLYEVRGGVAYQRILDRMEPQEGFYRAPADIAAGGAVVLAPPASLRDGDAVSSGGAAPKAASKTGEGSGAAAPAKSNDGSGK